MHLHVHVAFCEHLVVLLCVHETVHIFNFFFFETTNWLQCSDFFFWCVDWKYVYFKDIEQTTFMSYVCWFSLVQTKKNKQTKNTERMVSARYIHYLVATEIVDYRPVSKISLWKILLVDCYAWQENEETYIVLLSSQSHLVEKHLEEEF